MCIFDLLCSCDLDLDPITFIRELDPYYLEIYRMGKNVKSFESYCITACKCMHLVTCVFTSGHVTKMAITHHLMHHSHFKANPAFHPFDVGK